MTNDQPRQQRGRPTGGQFTARTRPEGELDLTASNGTTTYRYEGDDVADLGVERVELTTMDDGMQQIEVTTRADLTAVRDYWGSDEMAALTVGLTNATIGEYDPASRIEPTETGYDWANAPIVTTVPLPDEPIAWKGDLFDHIRRTAPAAALDTIRENLGRRIADDLVDGLEEERRAETAAVARLAREGRL